MRQHILCAALSACALLAASAAQAQNQPSADRDVPPAAAHQQAAEIARGDPARWYKEDKTMAAHQRTLQKEINAALAEALHACRSMAAAERAGCVKEARTNYQHDMAQARGHVMAHQ